ncbi:efflux RND transporter periplasmic adaptor subunit [Planctomicrobium sp. SH668]|uniref:efflux RND transporter periplasmic adaptor subunit n=1 Tax=Planctomicrobium sp. SH668 TaxID=3448126 RepID=UPI003F5AFCE3
MAQLALSHQIPIHPAAPLPVQVLTLTEQTVHPRSKFSGVVAELRKAELSFRVGGTIQNLLDVPGVGGGSRDVHEGDQVSAGSILASLDPSDYERERNLAVEKVTAAMARLTQARADAVEANESFLRASKLNSSQALSQAALDDAQARQQMTEAAVVIAERDIASAEIQLKQCEENLAYCQLRAPFPVTTIAARNVDAHQRIQSGQGVFLVHDLTSVVIAFAVQDVMLPQLRIGDSVVVTAEGLPRQKFEGVIHKIGTTANPQTRSYAVEVRIDQPGALRPGMIATVHFQEEQRAVMLPMTAIIPGEKLNPAVFRVLHDQDVLKVEQVPVRITGVFNNNVLIEVSDEAGRILRLGDTIVGTGAHRMREGQEVHIVD